MEVDGKYFKIAHFRQNKRTEQCELQFRFTTVLPYLGEIDTEVKAVRQATDNIDSLLHHIQNKIIKILQDKFQDKNKIITDDFAIPISLVKDKNPVDNKTVLEQFPKTISKTSKILFEIFDQKYIVLFNLPLIKDIELPPVLYTKSSVKPMKFDAIFTNHSKSQFIWFKSQDKIDWTKVGEGYFYNIKPEDNGYFLKFVCVPVNDSDIPGIETEVISDSSIEDIGDLPRCPFEVRHTFTKEKLSGQDFRVVSYNILSERYTYKYDHFLYCDKKYLSMDYRKLLIHKELVGYTADIICLQEVDSRFYSNYFKDYLKTQGFAGYYNKKGNTISEGLAIFFRKTRFRQESVTHIVFSELIQDHSKRYKKLWSLLKGNDDMRNEFLKQSTSFQITVLNEKNTNRYIIVGNTHLYYHPDANHIRLIQVTMATSYLTYLKDKYKRAGNDVSVIFCGDFNSSPKKSLLPFMLQGRIDPRHADCLKINENGKAHLKHDFKFESACGRPKYTNYTADYKDCLDYIFIESDNLSVTKVVPLPDEEELAQYEGLPNKYYPSDHLALVVDLQMK